MDFASIFIFIYLSQKLRHIISDQHICVIDKQSNLHNLVCIFLRNREFGTCNIFEASHFFKFSAKNRFIKSKCLFRIAIKINPRVYCWHK